MMLVAKAKRSDRIMLFDMNKLKLVNADTKKLFRAYEKDMTLRELSPGTIKGYTNDLQQWFIFILDNQDNKSVLELDEDDLTDFFYYCKSNGNNTRRMRRRYASVSAFYKFLRKKRKIIENPMEFVDRPIKDTDVVTQTYLTEEQVVSIKKQLADSGNLTLEVYALLSLSTMARVTAISQLRWEQVDYLERVIHDVLEKEGKIVNLFFSEECASKMRKLQTIRELTGIEDGGYIFFGKNKDGNIQPVTAATLGNWARKIGHLVGESTLHPHDFRHSASQLLKLKGMPLEEISELLNHESTETTRKHYLRPDTKSLRESKDKYEI